MKEDRLEELASKDILTDDEMGELVHLSPPGAFKSGPNLYSLGVTDLERTFENLKEGTERTCHALEQGCYLEVISLRLQHIEFWLRIFYVVKNRKGKIFDPEDKRMFGDIINDCKQLGFRDDLLERLLGFNKNRINAIHKYLLGGTDYDELREVCVASNGLDGEVGKYVRQEVEIPFNLLSSG